MAAEQPAMELGTDDALTTLRVTLRQDRYKRPDEIGVLDYFDMGGINYRGLYLLPYSLPH